jgi:iron complex transport system permease protein
MDLLAFAAPTRVVRPVARPAASRGPWLAALAALLVAVAALGAGTGKVAIPLEAQAGLLARAALGVDVGAAWPASTELIFLEIRLPRVVLAGLVGAALAVAGVAYQGLFRNPLADPYLLGVAPGAGLGAVVALTLPLPLGWYGLGAVQAAAFVGAVGAVGAVYLLGRVGGTTPITTLLLAGVAVGALAGAGTAYLMYASGDRLLVAYAWLLGGFNVASWAQVRLVAPPVLAGVVVLALAARRLDALQLGEEPAAALGLRVELAKGVLVGAGALVTAAAVSAAGLIGFVGIVAPHTVRMLLGPGHRRLLPAAALVGAAFLIAADALVRALPGPAELPVGVLTALSGAPLFVLLLRRHKRSVF